MIVHHLFTRANSSVPSARGCVLALTSLSQQAATPFHSLCPTGLHDCFHPPACTPAFTVRTYQCHPSHQDSCSAFVVSQLASSTSCIPTNTRLLPTTSNLPCLPTHLKLQQRKGPFLQPISSLTTQATRQRSHGSTPACFGQTGRPWWTWHQPSPCSLSSLSPCNPEHVLHVQISGHRAFSSTSHSQFATPSFCSLAAEPSGSGGNTGSRKDADIMEAVPPERIRSFCIIAHIDHGKTTLADRLLNQAQAATAASHGTSSSSVVSAPPSGSPESASGGEGRSMDSGVLERERGITILAKYTSFMHKGYLINMVDTPGHADFGGEVERVLGLVDGAVLLVDATEGPLAQTKFVLGKALQRGLKPMVVLNKVDRPSATSERCDLTESALLDLFVSKGADDDQLEFPVLYASAKQGWVSKTLPPPGAAPQHSLSGFGMAPLLDMLIETVPAPREPVDAPFAVSVAMIERDPYVGRIATGRVASGRAKAGDKVHVLSASTGKSDGETYKIVRITKRVGMNTMQIDRAVAGDVVSICGVPAAITDTIASLEVTLPINPGHVDPPTLSMVFGPNDSPLAGTSGGVVATGRAIGERLMAEAETSVSLRVTAQDGGTERFEVQARGELQLSVLIENLRRDGLELAVSPPQVLTKMEDGVLMEPFEEVTLEVDEELTGQVIEALSTRKGELKDMVSFEMGNQEGSGGGRQRLTFEVPSRGLIGYKPLFVNLTRGEGIMSRSFLKYAPHKGPLGQIRKGGLISSADGTVSRFALSELQPRGVFFVHAGEQVYAGQVVGEHTKENDVECNVARVKATSNVRQAHAEKKLSVIPPRPLTLEEAIGYVQGDELIEVTPHAVRLRKQELDSNKRLTMARLARQRR